MKRTKQLLTASGVAALVSIGSAGVVTAATSSTPTQADGPTKILSSLVADGTISQTQADKIAAKFTEKRAEHKAVRSQRRAAMTDVVTKTLGISKADLQAQLKSGKNLGQLAGDKKDELKSALVAQIKKMSADAVKAGRISQERADKMSANASKIADRILAGKGRAGGQAGGAGRFMGASS